MMKKYKCYFDKKDTPFDKRSETEIQIYNHLKQKNQIIKKQKNQQKQIEKPKVKTLTYPSTNNKGFTNTLTLTIIGSLITIGILLIIYITIWR